MFMKINDDINLKKIVNSGQCFRAAELDEGKFRFISGNKVLVVKQTGKNNYEANWDDYWKNYFDLERSYKNIKPKDKFMIEAYEFSKGIRILRQDPFETLISFIISQRRSIPAIKTCVERLCKKYGEVLKDGLYGFPSPETLAEGDLSDCGLGYRQGYVKSAAKLVAKGELDLASLYKLSTADLKEELLNIRGVGEKVANCVMLFAYGRTECAPVDTWIQRIIDTRYKGKNPFPAYKNNAGIMQQYIFYYTIENKPK